MLRASEINPDARPAVLHSLQWREFSILPRFRDPITYQVLIEDLQEPLM
jgi:hypothetical protein